MRVRKIWRLGDFSRTLAGAPRLLPYLALALALFWLGTVLSVWLAPASQQVRALSLPEPTADAGRVAALHWFGEMVSPELAAAQGAAPLTLVGVYASGNAHTDFALVGEGDKVSPVRVGQQTGGWTLLEVLPSAIRIGQNGNERRVELARPTAAAGALTTAPAPMPPPASPDFSAPVPLPDATAAGVNSMSVVPEAVPGEAEPGAPSGRRRAALIDANPN